MANKVISSFDIGTGDNYTLSVPYGSCSTAAATAAKTVSVGGQFALETGAIVAVKFTVTNTAASPTLNVDSTGAKAIYYKGAAITASYLKANYTYQFMYNGTQWDLIGEIDTDTDTKVTQTVTTTNASYPLLLAPSGQTATTTTTSYFDSGVTLNPSTNTIAANISGNAATATKLAAAKTISLTGDVTGSTTFDGSGNASITATVGDNTHNHNNSTIDNVSHTKILWTGDAKSGSVTPLGASLSAEHSANRLAYLNPNAMAFEYSDDGGSTWTTMSRTDQEKVNFVTAKAPFAIGSASTVTTNHRSRLTITAQNGTNGYVYTKPRKLLLNVNTSGHGISVIIETKTGASGASWTTEGTYTLSGWSGWNDIPLTFASLGGGINQTSNIWYMRLTFATTSVNSSYATTKSTIISMRLFGDTCWTRTSNMGETGHLYSYDYQQNATFPAKVTATSFSGSLSGNASSATKATQDASGNVITTTYAKLASPALTGTPTAPTATAGTNTTQIATTAFVTTAIGNLATSDSIVVKEAAHADAADTATTATQVSNSLKVGSKTYNGSTEVTILPSDLGLSSAMIFVGSVSSLPTSGNVAGDVVLYGNKEYVWDGESWIELGDEGSHALKSITISAGDGLTGGGSLEANRTISHGNTSSVSNLTANGRKYVTGLTFDTYGHVTGYTTGTETVVDTNTTYSAGTGLALSGTTFNHSNSVTAGTAQGDASKTLTFGGTFTIPTVTYDAQGHITSKGTTTMTMPANPNTDTHYTTGLTAGASGTTTNAATSNPYIKVKDNSTHRAQVQLKGSGATTVSSDANGVITISSTDNNTTYSTATTSANGLMTSAMVTKLNGIATGATANTGTVTSVATGTGLTGGTITTSGTISLATSGVTAGTYGPSANVSGSNGATISVPQITVDTYGRVTSVTNRTYTSVNTDTNTDVNVTMTKNTSSKYYVCGTTSASTNTGTQIFDTGVYVDTTAGKFVATSVYGAVWNDYAEYRQSDVTEAGRVICENGDDTLSLAVERLQPGANVVSDTFGFAIGETDECKTPIAVSGRVLVYPYEDRESYKPGDAVCAAPNGTVSKMTREEIREYPERIIGTVSAIPSYDTWGTGNVKVNGRIWIKVR